MGVFAFLCFFLFSERHLWGCLFIKRLFSLCKFIVHSNFFLPVNLWFLGVFSVFPASLFFVRCYFLLSLFKTIFLTFHFVIAFNQTWTLMLGRNHLNIITHNTKFNKYLRKITWRPINKSLTASIRKKKVGRKNSTTLNKQIEMAITAKPIFIGWISSQYKHRPNYMNSIKWG